MSVYINSPEDLGAVVNLLRAVRRAGSELSENTNLALAMVRLVQVDDGSPVDIPFDEDVEVVNLKLAGDGE